MYLYIRFVLSPSWESGPFIRDTRSLSLEISVIMLAVLCGFVMALFLLHNFIILQPKAAERRNMSAIIHVMGRPTKDPVMQQAQNGGSEYVLLDIAATQRNQKGENETIFYNCYFNKFQGQRLINAGVKSGTCLWVYGSLELQPFIYQKGPKQGQAGINAKVSISDWQFAIANRTENNPAANNGNSSAGNYNAGGIPVSNPGMAPPNNSPTPQQGPNYSAPPQQNPAYQNYQTPTAQGNQGYAGYYNGVPPQAPVAPVQGNFNNVSENYPGGAPQLPFK